MTQETRACASCQTTFDITERDAVFYQSIAVPPPTWCPACRAQRRMAWRNQWRIFRKEDAHSGKSEFSIFSEHSPVNIYETAYWESDNWDPMQYGRDYDFSRSFFEQFAELMRQVPLPSRSITANENSDYSLNANHLRNCYLVRDASETQDSAYIIMDKGSRDCYDCSTIFNCERCYDSFNLHDCYQAIGSVDCENSKDILFCKDLVSSSNCVGSVGLRNKQYCWFNEQLSKEEYEAKVRDLELASHQTFEQLRQQSYEHWLRFPVKFMHGTSNEQVTGEYVYESKNVQHCYLVRDAEDSRYCDQTVDGPIRDSYDLTTFGQGVERIYESAVIGLQSSNIKFSWFCLVNARDIEYSTYCQSSQNLFGCVSLRHKQFCILNKQYSEAEYYELVARIRQQMLDMPYVDSLGREYRYGEFFPPELSPHEYNTTVAQEFFSKTREEVLDTGSRWYDQPVEGTGTSSPIDQLPDTLDQSAEELVGQPIDCAHHSTCSEQCSGRFTVIGQELAFLLEQGLPLPRLCPNCRHYQRLRHRSSFQLHSRQCQCSGIQSSNGVYTNHSTEHPSHTAGEACPNTFQTSFAPDRPDIVYCEVCYLKEIL